MKEFTRKQYLAKECTHQEYYNQFVTPYILKTVERAISLQAICNSSDPHFNGIPLASWDRVARQISYSNPIAAGVCIAKAAARIIKANHK